MQMPQNHLQTKSSTCKNKLLCFCLLISELQISVCVCPGGGWGKNKLLCLCPLISELQTSVCVCVCRGGGGGGSIEDNSEIIFLNS